MKILNCQTLGEMCKFLLDGEPVFVLRAKDVLSMPTLAKYKEQAIQLGATNVGRTTSAMKEFTDWQNANLHKVKVPD